MLWSLSAREQHERAANNAGKGEYASHSKQAIASDTDSWVDLEQASDHGWIIPVLRGESEDLCTALTEPLRTDEKHESKAHLR